MAVRSLVLRSGGVVGAAPAVTSIGPVLFTGSVDPVIDQTSEAASRAAPSQPDDVQPSNSGRVVVYIIGTIALLLLGAAIGRAIPPFTLDWPWLAKFVTSPGLGGLAAVCAAVIALVAALTASRQSAHDAAADRVQREHAEQRAQWWNRFAWAADHAVDADTAELGISVLSKLIDQGWVMEEDNLIARAVADVVTPEDKPRRRRRRRPSSTPGKDRA